MALGDAAREQGLDPGRVTPWLGSDVACFFEIHIEQGRRLESGAVRIGLVDSIAGAVRLRFDIGGRAYHTGATPMRMREDALAAASEIVLVAERVARAHGSTVATVGRLNVTPNNLTTVPAGVALRMDIRDVDADLQRTATDEILAGANEIRERRPVRIGVESLSTRAPVVCTPGRARSRATRARRPASPTTSCPAGLATTPRSLRSGRRCSWCSSRASTASATPRWRRQAWATPRWPRGWSATSYSRPTASSADLAGRAGRGPAKAPDMTCAELCVEVYCRGIGGAHDWVGMRTSVKPKGART